jgi:hypothetical protein
MTIAEAGAHSAIAAKTQGDAGLPAMGTYSRSADYLRFKDKAIMSVRVALRLAVCDADD